jgi:hypothetical protein
MKFGIHNPSFVFGPDPVEAFAGISAKAQWAETHGFTWFSVMDHLIQIPPVGAADEPFIEGWTVLSALAAVTSRIRRHLPPRSPIATRRIWRRSLPALISLAGDG